MVSNKLSKQLRRSSSNKVILGVCGGVAEYFGIDVILVRVAWILITTFTGFAPGVVAYVLAGLVMPV